MSSLNEYNYIWNADDYAHACNCVGPRNGEPLCPCMMMSKALEKQKWLEELKLIYDLVPKTKEKGK